MEERACRCGGSAPPLWNDMNVIYSLHRDPRLLTRTTHVSFPSTTGVMTAKDPVIPSIHTCYYTYKPK